MLYLCLSAQGVENALLQLGDYKYAEWRSDLIGSDIPQLTEVLKNKNHNFIVTCRPGVFTEDYDIKMLYTAALSGAEYVDLEIERAENNAHFIKDACIKSKKCKLIISYHNYDETPDVETLNNIILKCRLYGADIVKIACKANNKNDCSRILSLYQENKDIVAFCMGEFGKITRVASLYLGAKFTYVASSQEGNTAPGQLTLNQTSQILDILK
ncbi:MAG: type I 3-dehydroquinate dehydratase [Bacteroidales bacterium]|nr:type I 3-dehydroquinate dehydratase [Bacteroidales bacterium]